MNEDRRERLRQIYRAEGWGVLAEALGLDPVSTESQTRSVLASCHAEITRIRAENERLREVAAEITRLKEALSFYADESIYSDWFRHDDNNSTAERDCGQRARKALEGK